ncbi:MAG: hypothetical protein P8J14_07850 [Emcibacteraceae bacterium]|nr:hypothetical protein [Emcibacteraceae bacterium]
MYKVEVGNYVKTVINDVVALKKSGEAKAIISLLNKMCESPKDVMAALPNFDKDEITDEVLLYVDADVTVYYIATTPKIVYPPHEHAMVAISAIYKGTETHLFYDREGDNVVERSQVRFQSPAVVDMAVETVHAILNEDAEPNESLHFYFGNLEDQKRTLWDSDGKNPQQYVQSDYDSFAKPY